MPRAFGVGTHPGLLAAKGLWSMDGVRRYVLFL
jgi:hypothetical protein